MATFYKWGKRNDLVEDDPSYQIEKPKTPKTYAGLAGTERTRHFQSLDTQLRRYPGDDIWPQSGLRISEALSLQVHQIRVVDSVATSVRVIGKGNKERQVPLPESFGRVLALTIVGKTPDEYLFAKKPWQKPASAHAARAYQKKLIDKAGMKKCT